MIYILNDQVMFEHDEFHFELLLINFSASFENENILQEVREILSFLIFIHVRNNDEVSVKQPIYTLKSN